MVTLRRQMVGVPLLENFPRRTDLDTKIFILGNTVRGEEVASVVGSRSDSRRGSSRRTLIQEIVRTGVVKKKKGRKGVPGEERGKSGGAMPV